MGKKPTKTPTTKKAVKSYVPKPKKPASMTKKAIRRREDEDYR